MNPLHARLEDARFHFLVRDCACGFEDVLNTLGLIWDENGCGINRRCFTHGLRLNALELDRNRLTRLPEEITRCSKLETMMIGFNELALLPPGIGSLRALRTISAEHNRITAVPRA